MKLRSALLAAISFVFISIAGNAQVARTTFGLRAGVNFQNLNGKDEEGDNLDNKLKTGFNIGVNAEIPVAADFYIQPGLLFTTKGARNENNAGNADVKVKLSYIEIPVNFLYKPVLGKNKLLLGFGPYAAFGVAGQVEANNNEADIEWEKEITPAQSISGTPYFKRFDAGANFLVGYELSSNISAQLNAQLGLVNISPKVTNSNDETAVKNTGFGISLGYRF